MTRTGRKSEIMYQSSVGSLHVGIIMDGNGRWAEARGLSRISGHARGARRVTEIVESCPDLGVTHLTLYAFSTENWRRPLEEVDGLMRIFRLYIVRRMNHLRDRNVRVRFIGMRHRVPPRLGELMYRLEDHTRACDGLNLTIAIDYGGRDELTRAVRTIAREVRAGVLSPEDLSAAVMSRTLDTHALPDPDLIIRTSGERRVSNFLLWQGVYSEYDFPEKSWPDFTSDDLGTAVRAFRSRDRRFGGTAARPHPHLVALPGGGR
jgi:undecaprenyl diphosphate synthase